MIETPRPTRQEPWYGGVSRYQWTVLAIASLGWVFDVFEGQIFVAAMNEALPDLLPAGTDRGDIAYYGNLTFGAFLIGGALGGVLFGMLSDRIGRVRCMIYTILVYSIFTCLSALARTWWHMAGFRFLVALGVGGEWAVASALVAEVFPTAARARSLAIFHATSVLGTILAVLAGALIVGNPHFGWRWGFVLGAAPALLTLWVRRSLCEPETWIRSQGQASPSRTGPAQLFRAELARRTLIGVGLATVGLATFWGAHIHGKEVLHADAKERLFAEHSDENRQEVLNAQAPMLKRWEMLGMFLVTIGGGLGLVCFGPLSEYWGRRMAFVFYHIGGLAAALLLFKVIAGTLTIIAFLPVFGFFTLGMHAGYAVYFPELFPTVLRGTGAGFCFNVGRLLAAPVLFLAGWLQTPRVGMSLNDAASLLSFLFAGGLILIYFAPETHGTELPA